MNTLLNRIASVLAFIIGGMAVFAGGQVLLGNDPGYFVISWLPVYNYTLGILTVSITAIWIWKNSRYALFAALTTFGLHTLVMLILQTAYRNVAAVESIQAMTIRLAAWILILSLMFIQLRKDRPFPKPTAPNN